MLALLQRPYPQETHWKSHLKDALLASSGVAFVLSMLQPFGLDEIEGQLRWQAGLYFGMVTLVVMLLNYLWMLAFPRFFGEQQWTLGREMLWASYSFVSISLGNFLLGRYLFPDSGLFARYGPILLVTVVVGLLPYLLITYINATRHLRRHLATALAFNQQVQQAQLSDTQGQQSSPVLRFVGDAELLPAITLHQLLYVEAEGNYLRIWTLHHDQPTDYRLRATLTQQAQAWAEHPQLLRTHRAFLVNLTQVQQVEGNSAGYRLRLHPARPQVPVSRGQAGVFKAAFQRLMEQA